MVPCTNVICYCTRYKYTFLLLLLIVFIYTQLEIGFNIRMCSIIHHHVQVIESFRNLMKHKIEKENKHDAYI